MLTIMNYRVKLSFKKIYYSQKNYNGESMDSEGIYNGPKKGLFDGLKNLLPML